MPSFPRTPFLACGRPPPLRSGQVSLDEREHFLHNRDASVAALRELFAFGPECRSRSLRNRCSPSPESATNPENGTVIYTYNTDKTLATKTDALNQQFSYTYDSYKRVTQINLGQMVIRQFYYDTNPLDSTGTFSQYANGRLTAVQNAPTVNADTFIEMYSYTQPGGVTAKRLRMNRTVQSHAFTLDLDASYSYDNEGKMTSVTYPQSFYSDGSLQPQPSPVTTYTYGFDTMGRPTSMAGPGVDGLGNPATVNIVNNVQYGPASEMLQMSYFGSTATLQYNTRLQMTHLTIPGQLNINYNFATQNNGQISSQTDNLSGEQITYQYDALQRLYSATASGWSQTFTYDGFGNLTDKVGTGGPPTNHSPVNAATNQLTGYSYDANGNLITTGYGWDPENRMSYATFGGTQYAYDSANKRIWTGNYTCPGGFCGPGYGWQFQSETMFFYGIDGKQLAAYTPQVKYLYGIPQSIYCLLGEERVYFAGKYVGNANTSLMSGGTAVSQDRLGSLGKYFPYGEDRAGQGMFATYTRDSATGLDYADQRYYADGVGRFVSPDPYQANNGGAGDPADSGSWNRYTYTRGDPINRIDPQGLVEESPEWIARWVAQELANLFAGGPQHAQPPNTTVQEYDDVHPRRRLTATQIASKGAELAKKWLKDKDCKGLFNLSGNGYDPTQVLSALTSSGIFSSGLNVITLTSIPFGSTTFGGFTLVSLNPFMPGADIFFNTTFATDLLDDSALVKDAAATYIHELGHAYNDTPFSGGSAIVDDGWTSRFATYKVGNSSVSAQNYNTYLIDTNCNK